MFSRATDASKVALAHLVARLKAWRLSAARYAVRHRAICETFGVEEMPREEFQQSACDEALLGTTPTFGTQTYCGADVLQLITQTS